MEYYPTQQLSENPVTMSKPYYFLLHYRKQLEEMSQIQNHEIENGLVHERPNDKTIEHIQVLLAFLVSKYLEKIEKEEHRYRKSRPAATFALTSIKARDCGLVRARRPASSLRGEVRRTRQDE